MHLGQIPTSLGKFVYFHMYVVYCKLNFVKNIFDEEKKNDIIVKKIEELWLNNRILLDKLYVYGFILFLRNRSFF